MHRSVLNPARLGLALLLALLSAGCQSGSVAPRIGDIPENERTLRADAIVAEPARPTAAFQQRLLTAAMLYNSAEAYAKAIDTLNRIDTTRLPRDFRGDYIIVAVDAALGAGNTESAWQAVARAPARRYAFIDDLTPQDFARVAERRARVLEKKGQPMDALRERLVAGSKFAGDEARMNNEALWGILLRLEPASLRSLGKSEDAIAAGWATLALSWRESADSAALRAGRVSAWMQANPSHPAAVQMPAAIGRLRNLDTSAVGATRIAILLPQHGKLAGAGEAIRRGMLAAWYNAREAGAPMPALVFLDSSRGDFLSLYDDAVKAGAGLVIGPLEKENLRLLQQRSSLPVPTLALNYPDSNANPAGLHYFGLAGEDEGAQLATAALSKKLENIAILYPAADWGQRIAAQVEQTLMAGGARVHTRTSYGNDADFHELVRRMLDVGASEKRHELVQKAAGISLAFKPGRRTDIDGLFIIANTAQATQIAPAVQYYYGEGLPTFATSHVNSQPGPTAANDLAGTQFVEMPWMVEAENPLRIRAQKAWQENDDRYTRLYPLGIDALRIAQQLSSFAATPGLSIDGTTGVLTMDGNRRIHRQLVWMTFRDGAAHPVDNNL